MQTTASPEAMLTIRQVCDLLKLSRQQVYTLMHRGEFGELVRLGPQSLRITESGYRAYIERNRVAAP